MFPLQNLAGKELKAVSWAAFCPSSDDEAFLLQSSDITWISYIACLDTETISVNASNFNSLYTVPLDTQQSMCHTSKCIV